MQPFDVVKPLVDAWMPDGEFELLTPATFVLLNRGLWLAGASFLVLGIASVLHPQATQQWLAMTQARVRLQAHLWLHASQALLQAIWPAREERMYAAGLGLAVTLAVAARLPWLNRPMSHDEAYTVMVFARPGWWTALTDYHLPNNHILNSLLVSLILRWGGYQPWMVRLPVFLASLGVVVAVYLVGREMYSPAVGLGAALALAALPAMREYATNARGYMFIALFTLGMLWSGLIVIRQRNRAAWMLLVLNGVLGLFSVPVMLIPWGMIMLWLGATALWEPVETRYGSKRAFWLRWALSGILTAAITLVLYLPAITQSGGKAIFANPFVQPVAREVYGEVLRSRLRATWNEWTANVPLWIQILWVVGLLAAWMLDHRLSRRRVPLWVAGGLWISLFLFVRRPNPWPRIWYFALPLAALWGTAGWWGLLQHRRHSVRGLLVALMLIALLGSWREVAALPNRWNSQGADERAVVFLQGRILSTDILVVDSPDSAPVWYYSLLYGLPSDMLRTDRSFTRAFILVNTKEGQTVEGVWQARIPQSSTCLQTAHQIGKIGYLQVFECP